MQLDYRPLEEPVSDAMVKQYAASEASWATPKFIVIIAVGLWLLLTLPTILASISSTGRIDHTLTPMFVIMTVITIGVVTAAVVGAKLLARNIVRMKRLAEANGAVYIGDGSPDGMSGLIFDNGHARKINHAIAFKQGIELGTYQYVTGSGKNQQTHTYGYARVALGKELPNMVLDAKSNNFIGTNLPDSFHNSQKLQLEGDFNDHFNLYVPEKYKRDALYIFTPDVMQAVVDHGKNFDMEVVGSELYIYRTKGVNLTSKADIEDWLSVVGAITSELKDQSRRYVDERAVGQMQVVGSEAQPASIAFEGRRLKTTSNYVVISLAALVVFIVFAPGFVPVEIGEVIAGYGWLFMLLLGVFFIARKIRKR